MACSLKKTTGGESEKFRIVSIELILRSQLTWEDDLEILDCIATATMRPNVEVLANRHPVPLPETLGLKDFQNRKVMGGLLHYYDYVMPKVSQAFTLVAKVQISGRHIQFKGPLPDVVHGEAMTRVLPPAYSCFDITQETLPPSYV